jgi:radical SAM superfamily enzyme YgiQ (UPF0313 family)
MSFNKVLLVNLLSHESAVFHRRTVLRAGLGYIAQSLEDNGIEYRVVDLALGHSLRYLFRQIETFKPDLIGATLFTYRYLDAYHLLKLIKKQFKDVPVACGGPHVTSFRDTVLTECPEIDFGIFGEGEETIIQLCRGAAYDSIPGLLFRKDGLIVSSAVKPFIKDLAAVSFPKYTHFELQHYPRRNTPVAERTIPIVSSRGCPYDCIYCPVKVTIGQNFRTRNARNIMEELTYRYAQGYRRFSFIDDNFTLVRERVVSLCAEIRASGMHDLTLSLPNGIRADKVDAELLKTMYAAGFRYIGFGVEAGNNRILAMLKKHETIETIEKAVKTACETGYAIDLFFLVGSPGESPADVMDSIKVATRYPVDNIFFFNLIPYPGTELFEWIKKHGRLLFTPEHYLNRINSSMDTPVFETADFPKASRTLILRRAREAAREHKRDAYVRKLEACHVPGFLARVLASVYIHPLAQRLFNDSPLFAAIKRSLLSS